MEDHRFIPEFDSPRRPSAANQPVGRPARAAESRPYGPRRFRKGDAVAEIRQRNGRNIIEWSLVLNGLVVTTRHFTDEERAAYDRELHSVAADLEGSGWLEEMTSVA